MTRNSGLTALKPKKIRRESSLLLLSSFGLGACGGGGGQSNAGSYATIGALTGDARIDASLQGSYWSTVNLKYAVAGGLNGEYWFSPDDVYSRLSAAMNNVAEYTSLDVEGVGVFADPISAGAAGADIVLSLDGEILSTYLGDSVWAVGFYPNAAQDPLLKQLDFYYSTINGDMLLNLNSDANYLSSYEPGSQGFVLLLHELGHALGLKHPFDRIGDQPTYRDVGLIDHEFYSVMTYDDMFDDVIADAATFMINDVISLMYLYGTNNDTYSGDTRHSLVADGLFSTIWDAGGIDTVDLSTSNAPWIVHLPQYQYSEVIDLDVGWAQKNIADDRYEDTLVWLIGVFENVTGGSNNDELYGDDYNNIMRGLGGDDLLAGRGGNDILYGGLGADTFYLTPGDGNDIIMDWQQGIDSIRAFANDTYSTPINTSLSAAEDGMLVVSIFDGSSIKIEGLLYSDAVV